MRRARAVLMLITTMGLLATACDRDRNGTRRDQASDTPTTTAPSEAVVAAASADAAGEAKPSTGCGREQPGFPTGHSEQHTTSNAVERMYLLYIPTTAADRPRPLVFNIHGYGSSAANQVSYTGAEAVAEREGFVTIAPQGYGRPAAFDVIGLADVSFIGHVLDLVGEAVCIDLSRVYSMGMSNGGAMSAVLACRSPDRFAAVAPVALVVYVAPFCDGVKPTPISTFMGTADPVVPYNGGKITCCGRPTIRPAPEIMDDWAEHNGCDATPAVDDLASDVERRTWTACDGGADTVFYSIEDGGHTWPGAIEIAALGRTTASIDATQTIWSFFAAHQRL